MSSHNAVLQYTKTCDSSVRISAQTRRRYSFRNILIIASSALISIGAGAQTSTYVQTNIISDGSVPAAQTDPTLINPWGVSIGQGALSGSMLREADFHWSIASPG